jgi:hypothetical protein
MSCARQTICRPCGCSGAHCALSINACHTATARHLTQKQHQQQHYSKLGRLQACQATLPHSKFLSTNLYHLGLPAPPAGHPRWQPCYTAAGTC